MAAGKHNLVIEQGAKFTRSITVIGRNLTGYTARLQVRPAPGAAVLVELTTENGRIAITPATDSVIALTLGADVTDDLSFGTAQYDLEIIPDDGGGSPDETAVERLLEGSVLLRKEITVPVS